MIFSIVAQNKDFLKFDIITISILYKIFER